MCAATSRNYTGEYRHGIDPKNRVTIPAAWRSDGEETYKLRVDTTQSCLLVFTNEEFLKQIEKASQLPGISPRELQQFIRQFAGQAIESSADKQGRMVLPVELTRLIGLNGEAVLIGASNRFEIGNPEKWEAKKAAESLVYNNVASQLGM